MTTLERIGAELLAAVALIASALLWYHLHNLSEQRLGALACIEKTTEARSVSIRIDAIDAIEQGKQLTAQAATYDLKLQSLSAGNADLARRVFDNPVRESAGARAGAAACPTPANARLSESEVAAQQRLGRVRADLKFVLDACDANQARVEGLALTYNQWRDRMLAENAAP